MEEKKWGTLSDAVVFYGMAESTTINWRTNGKIVSKPVVVGKRTTYEYLLDDELKKEIDIMRSLDNRWKK